MAQVPRQVPQFEERIRYARENYGEWLRKTGLVKAKQTLFTHFRDSTLWALRHSRTPRGNDDRCLAGPAALRGARLDEPIMKQTLQIPRPT